MQSYRSTPARSILWALIATCALVLCAGCGGGTTAPTGQPFVTITAQPALGPAPMGVTLTAAVGRTDGTDWEPTRMGVDWGAYNSQEWVNGVRSQFSYTYTIPGTYTITCWAVDDRTGDTAQTSTIVQVVGITNSPPNCTLVADPISGDAPLLVRFTGTGSDSDGSIASYTLDYGDGSLGWSGTTAPTERGHIYTQQGTYRATLTVLDNLGATALVHETITVVEAPPPAP